MNALIAATIPALAVAALAEFLLVRVALRLGPAFPPGHIIDAGFGAAFWLGLWALNLAGALASGVLVISAAPLGRPTERRLQPGITAGCGAAVVVLIGWVLSIAD